MPIPPPAGTARAARGRLGGLALVALACGMVDLLGVWRAVHPHAGASYRRLYLESGVIANGVTRAVGLAPGAPRPGMRSR